MGTARCEPGERKLPHSAKPADEIKPRVERAGSTALTLIYPKH